MKKSTIMFSLILGAILVQCKPSFDLKNTYTQIIGTWAQNEEVNADFVISKKRIEYFDTGYSYDFEINDEKDFIILDSNKIVLKFKIIKLSKDSLIIKSKNDGNRDLIYKYYKR